MTQSASPPPNQWQRRWFFRGWLTCIVAVTAWGGFRWNLDRPGHPYRTIPFEHWSGERGGSINRLVTVPLERGTNGAGVRVQRIDLEDFTLVPWSNALTAGFIFEVYEDSPATGRRILDALAVDWAEFRSADGRFEFKAGRSVVHSGFLFELERATQSATSPEASTNRWSLQIATASPHRLTLRCVTVCNLHTWPMVPDLLGILCHRAGPQKGQPAHAYNLAFPQGRLTLPLEKSNRTRGELLAETWRFPAGTKPLTVGAIVLGVAWGLGFWLLPLRAPEGIAPCSFAWRHGLAGFCLFFAAGFADLLSCPPMRGVDEPAHVGSCLRLIGDDAGLELFQPYGRSMGFLRQFLRADQKFTADDIGTVEPWFSAMMDTRPAARSGFATHVWKLTEDFWSLNPSGVVVARLRLVSLLTVAAAFGLAMGTVARRGRFPWTFLLLLLVPCLPWFSMIVSNYPFTIAAMLLLLAGLLCMLQSDALGAWEGGMVGIGTGLALHNSAGNATVVAAVIVFMVIRSLRWIARCKPAPESWAQCWPFWTSLGAALLASRWFSMPEYDAIAGGWFLDIARKLHLGALARFASSAGIMSVLGALLLLEAAAMFLWREHESPKPDHGARWPWIALALLAGFFMLNTFSHPVHLPPLNEATDGWDPLPRLRYGLPWLEDFESPRQVLSPLHYVKRSVLAVLTSFGAGKHDYMASLLFWGYVGDPATVMPDWVVSACCTFFAIGLGLWFLHLAREADAWTRWMTQAWLVATALCLVAPPIAARLSVSQPSIHGRYLIGFYMFFLTLCGLGWEQCLGRLQKHSPLVATVGIAALLLGVQFLKTYVILERFF